MKKHGYRQSYLVYGNNEQWEGTSTSFWITGKIKFRKFPNLKFWQILKENNGKSKETITLSLVIFGGCPCEICESFNLGHLEISIKI